MFDALILLLAAAGAQTADPLAPAREGKIQCIAPNRDKKTCMGLGRYDVATDGSFTASSEVLVSPTPLITMRVTSKGKVEDGAVCAKVLRSDYEAATYAMNGQPVDDATAAAIRAQVLTAVAAMENKMGCSRERPDGDLLVEEVTLDGVARPDLTHKTLWVKPDEGYTLGM